MTKYLCLLVLLGAFGTQSLARAASPDIVFADFEGTDYGDWQSTGKAFGPGPAQGTLPGERPISDFEGHGLVNSFYLSDGATGTLTSPDFTLNHRFIRFLIGGGGWEGKTCANLIIDGKTVRSATGPNTSSGGSTALASHSWDVAEFAGRSARIEIVDTATGNWGHIALDQIVFTDSQATSQVASSADGELLYNGIRLPREWPPRLKLKTGLPPMPVPYLEHPPAVIPIDVGRQLFVDDFLIEQTTLKRQFHYPQRYAGNPIIKPETPSELNDGKLPLAAMISDGVCYDPQAREFKLWYQAGWRDATVLATSQDGLHWMRPKFDVDPGTNRVLPKKKLVRHGTAVAIDPYTTDSQQRFKMLIYENDVRKASAYVSPDGVHWSFQGHLPECGDNSTIFYNPFRKKWVFSIRLYRTGRARDYFETSDFLQGISWDQSQQVPWANTDSLDLPDAGMMALLPGREEIQKEATAKKKTFDETLKDYRFRYGDPTQLYNLDAVAYESVMLGVFGILRGPTSGATWNKLKAVKLNDLELAYSRDGFHWDRPDRTAFLASTRKEGDWDRGYLHSGVGICTVMGDKLYFYYSGWSGISPALDRDTYAGGATGVAMLRRDGFASMDAGAQAGKLVTRQLTFKGRFPFVNVDLAASKNPSGDLRVAVLDAEGKVIAPFSLENCLPINSDSTRQRVAWNGATDLSSLAGKHVRFQFQLTRGRLYSFWVSPDASGASYGYVAAGGPEFDGPIDTVGGK